MGAADKPSASALVDAKALAELLAAREHLYMLFHKLLGGVPTEDLVAMLLSDTTAEALDAYADGDEIAGFGRLLDEIQRKDWADFTAQAHDEFNCVFYGLAGVRVHPWESPHVSRKPSLIQKSTLEVRSMFEAYGLEPKMKGHVSNDHVSIICAFMANLAGRSVQAFARGEFAAFKTLMADQHHFLLKHMCNWLPMLVAQASKVEEPILYPQAIAALATFTFSDANVTAQAATWAENVPRGALSSVEAQEVLEMSRIIKNEIVNLASLRLVGLDENELAPIDSDET